MAGLWTSGRGKITFYVKDSDDFQLNSKHESPEKSKSSRTRSSRGIFFLPPKALHGFGNSAAAAAVSNMGRNSNIR